MEAKLRAREGANVKAKCVHAEMAACIHIILIDDVQACGLLSRPTVTTVTIAERQKGRDNRRILSRKSLLRRLQPQGDG